MRAGSRLALLALVFSILTPAAAQASFGFLPGDAGMSAGAKDDGGVAAATLAGSHPYSVVTEANFNKVGESPDGDLRNLAIEMPAGLIENPTAVPKCSLGELATPRNSPFETSLSGENCLAASQIGTITLKTFRGKAETRTFGVFNLAPPPGSLLTMAFSPYGVPVIATSRLRDLNQDYGTTLSLENFPRQLHVTGFRLIIWGTPWAFVHSFQRGNCLNEGEPSFGWSKCKVKDAEVTHTVQPYLTLPVSCQEPLAFQVRATSWQQPDPVQRTATSPPLQGCDELPFAPIPSARLSSDRTTSTTGFDFTLDGSSRQLLDPQLRATSQAKKAVVRLTEGMTVNPSVASGLGTCSEAQYASETVSARPGEGCPNDSKVGDLTIESPLHEGRIEGAMFFATPRQNPFGTLLALYMVAKDSESGILVKVAGRVDSDPETGRLTATFDDLPQLPYAHFNLHLREGQRSPLATPPACGAYATEVDVVPWRDPSKGLHVGLPFSLTAGIGGGPCPQGAIAPFAPKSMAGTINSNAGSYSPFYLHLTRADNEQEITSYSAQLPRGLLGSIAHIPFCSEAQID
ncbi:MAG TPA: hypothetical protein VGO36_02680, partial [Solirubrobacterales bacterium]|nr:hypothetical protein [Solirubrobacterales bacterium]